VKTETDLILVPVPVLDLLLFLYFCFSQILIRLNFRWPWAWIWNEWSRRPVSTSQGRHRKAVKIISRPTVGISYSTGTGICFDPGFSLFTVQKMVHKQFTYRYRYSYACQSIFQPFLFLLSIIFRCLKKSILLLLIFAATARGKEVSQNFLSEIKSAMTIEEPARQRGNIPKHVVAVAQLPGPKKRGRPAYHCTVCKKNFAAASIRYRYCH